MAIDTDKLQEFLGRELVTEAGFTRFRRAAQTPFNLVHEVRP